MSRSRRIVPVLIALCALVWAVSLGAAAEPAMADRCQPEELVLGPGNSPIGHDDDDPRCPIMQAALYDQVSCDQTTFLKCVNSLSPEGTVAMQVQRAKYICIGGYSSDEDPRCYMSVGDVPSRVLGFCLSGWHPYGCETTVGDLLPVRP